jgi:alkyl-hydroperoxide reductase/thiol specific antioxidant family protein
LRDEESRFAEAGVGLAAVGLGDMRYARSFFEETGIAFPLLVDEDRVAYRAAELGRGSLIDIFRRDNAAARARARTAGHRQHRLGKNPFQLGGSFVFGPGDQVLFAHVSRTFGDNAEPRDFLDAAVGRDLTLRPDPET